MKPLDTQVLGPGASGAAGSRSSQLAQLEGANQQLRTRLQEVLGELAGAQQQVGLLQRLQGAWEEGAPPEAAVLVEAALAQERVAQEARSERVLAVLQAKASASCECWRLGSLGWCVLLGQGKHPWLHQGKHPWMGGAGLLLCGCWDAALPAGGAG